VSAAFELSLKGLTRIFTDQTDQGQAITTAGLFDRLKAGSSTGLLTKYVSNLAQDDRVVVDTGESKGMGKSGSRFLRCAAE
jgi:hypothetical protein